MWYNLNTFCALFTGCEDAVCFGVDDKEGKIIIKISLCDDENAQLVQVEAFLREYSVRHPDLELSVAVFSSGADLLEHLQIKGVFDIYLLDVIMPGQDGIQLGLRIREYDQGGRIIYFTSSPDFAVDSYRAKASDYLLKPLEKDRLFQSLDDAVKSLGEDRQAFTTVKTKEGIRRIPLREIICGELVRRRIQYHLSDGSVVEGMSLRRAFQEAIAPLTAHRYFVLCATSFFVNLTYVEMIDASGLRLTGGKVVPVSRGLRAEVTRRWLDFHLEGGC